MTTKTIETLTCESAAEILAAVTALIGVADLTGNIEQDGKVIYSNPVSLSLVEETLTDGSTVFNLKVAT